MILLSLGGSGVQPWVCTGDFNEVLRPLEKKGGRGV